MSVCMAQAEALIEFASAVAQVAINGGAEIVIGMQRLGDGAVGHGLVERHPAEDPIHRADQCTCPRARSQRQTGQADKASVR